MKGRRKRKRRSRWHDAVSESTTYLDQVQDWESFVPNRHLSRRVAHQLTEDMYRHADPAGPMVRVAFRPPSETDDALAWYGYAGRIIVYRRHDATTVLHEVAHAVCWRFAELGLIDSRSAQRHAFNWIDVYLDLARRFELLTTDQVMNEWRRAEDYGLLWDQ